MRSRFERAEPYLSALFVLLGCGLALHHMADDAATTDEPVHIASGVEIVRQGTGRWNPEHPPLAKALAGLALTGLPIAPAPDPFSDPAHAGMLFKFLFANDTPGETILFRARLPFVLLFAALLLALRSEAARRFGGPAAGFFALALAALEPNLIAHAGVVHTDLAVTLFVLLSLRPLSELGDPTERSPVGWLGLLWGLAFLSKYSAPLLVLATLPLLAVEDGLRERIGTTTLRLAAAAGIAVVVTLGGFALAYRFQVPADRTAVARDRLLVRGQSPVSFDAAEAVGRVCPPAENLLTGAFAVALQSRAGAGANYFLGRVSPEGSPFYFPVALATKTALGLGLAALFGAVSYRGRKDALAAAAGLGLFLLLSARTTYNIGVRHILLAFPLAAIVASASAESGASSAIRRRRAVLAGLLLVEAVETLAVHPHELSFFNALAGGTRGGRRLFVDSNLDWGQDLVRLAKAAPRYSKEPLPAVVFGGDLPRRHAPALRAVAPGDEDREGALIAIGEQPLALGPELLASKGAPRDAARLEALRRAIRGRGTRVGEIGGSIGIWRLGPPEPPK